MKQNSDNMSRPMSPREDQVMFGDGVRIKWKNPNDLGNAGINLEVKECNLVVTFNTNAFALVRRAILDYYKDHKKLSVFYVTDRSATNERLDKFRVTHNNETRGSGGSEFTITFTNTKTSAIVSGQLTDVYQFILNDLNDIETLIHNRHTESVMLDRKMKDMRLEPPSRQGDWGSPMASPGGRRDWGSPLGSPNPSRRDSFTSSTMSMHSDQDTLDSISTDFGFREATPGLKPLSPRRETKPRPSYLSVNDCYHDSSDNSNNSNESPKVRLSQMNGHASPDHHQRPAKSQIFNFHDIKPKVDGNTERYKKPPPGYGFCNGQHSVSSNDHTQVKTTKNEIMPKFPRPRRAKKGSNSFVFAVHMVNIQRSMVNLQKTVTALEEKIEKSLDSKQQNPAPTENYTSLLDKIQAIIREELRLIKDDVTSSKTQIKCNRELIKRVYVELNQRITKDVTELDGRVSKLEQKDKLRREQRRKKSNGDHSSSEGQTQGHNQTA